MAKKISWWARPQADKIALTKEILSQPGLEATRSSQELAICLSMIDGREVIATVKQRRAVFDAMLKVTP